MAGHPRVVAIDCVVTDVAAVWPSLVDGGLEFSSAGIEHVALYASATSPGRILLIVAVDGEAPLTGIATSPVTLQWFDALGVTDIPPMFAGKKIDDVHHDRPLDDGGRRAMIAALVSVSDVEALLGRIHTRLTRFERQGVHRTTIYQAQDDGHEVLILQDFATEAKARAWIDHPDAAADWLRHDSAFPYPPLFVGTLVQSVSTHTEP